MTVTGLSTPQFLDYENPMTHQPSPQLPLVKFIPLSDAASQCGLSAKVLWSLIAGGSIPVRGCTRGSAERPRRFVDYFSLSRWLVGAGGAPSEADAAGLVATAESSTKHVADALASGASLQAAIDSLTR